MCSVFISFSSPASSPCLFSLSGSAASGVLTAAEQRSWGRQPAAAQQPVSSVVPKGGGAAAGAHDPGRGGGWWPHGALLRHIAGQAVAKQALSEMVILPTDRPEVWVGLGRRVKDLREEHVGHGAFSSSQPLIVVRLSPLY